MPEARRRSPQAKRRPKPAVEESEGLIGRLADLIVEHPAQTGGSLVIALTFAAIVGNAAFMQTKRHPDPFFATRGEAGVPLPREAPEDPIAEIVEAKPGAAPKPDAPKPDARPAVSEAEKERVAGIQRALAKLSLYSGPVDGLMGERTRAAILAYQRREGLQPNGEPSEALLNRLTHAASPRAEAADPSPTGSIPPAAPRDRGRVVALQSALNDLGYGPLTVDGRMGEATAEAIRRFELDNGMPITGLVDQDLIATMIRIGAIKGR